MSAETTETPDIDKTIAELMGYHDFWQRPVTGRWFAHPPDPNHIEDDRMPIPRPSADTVDAMELFVWACDRFEVGKLTASRKYRETRQYYVRFPFFDGGGRAAMPLGEAVCMAVIAACAGTDSRL